MNGFVGQMRRFARRMGALVGVAALGLGVCACGQRPATQDANPGEISRTGNTAGAASERRGGRYDLERDEERGGHTLARHVGRTDQELEQRLRQERNIAAASTWTDRDTAETTVAEALRTERGRIENWMRRGYPRANRALHYEAGRPIGRSLRRGETQAATCTKAIIVLRADGPESFYVLTAYPEAGE